MRQFSENIRVSRTEITDQFYKEIPKEIDHASKFLEIPGSFEQNLKTRSKSIYTRKSHKIDHFFRFLTFLAETEHFEQNMKKND